MPNIIRVASNVKGGVACDIGPKTFVVGANESGKTALVNAIELALTGRASQVYGRETAADKDLLELLAPKGEPLHSVIHFDDGSHSTFEMQPGKKPSGPRYFGPDGIEKPNTPWNVNAVMPQRALVEAIAGKADTARQFFLHFAVGVLSEKDLLEAIPAQLHAQLKQATIGVKATTSTIDKLLEALTVAEKRARECKAQVTASEKVEQATGDGLAAPADETQMTAARKAVADYEAYVGGLNQSIGAIRQAQHTPGLVSQQETIRGYAQAALLKAEAAMAEVNAASHLLAPAPADDGIPRAALLTVFDWQAREALSFCNACGTNVPPGHFEQRKVLAQSKVAERTALEENWARLRTAWAKAELDAREAKAEIARCDGEIARLQDTANTLLGQQAAAEAALAQGMAVLQNAKDALMKMTTTNANWAAATKARDAALQAKQEQHGWELLVSACRDAIKRYLDKGQDRLREEVQRRLPPTDRFLLQLRNSKNKAVFRFGLERDGRLDVALSGGKWAHVMAAMADVCRVQEGYALLVPEDRGFDPTTLTGVLHSLGTCNAQVLVQSTTRPSHEVPGWTVVDADLGQHRVGLAAVAGKLPSSSASSNGVTEPPPAQRPLPAI